ncbi:unnamed protein product, partial [Rodentolepis nana]|uniref:Uncharacterized protein n=1 Tax=Rodentolepis nana TaxID=102285 RepID=A0A0R3TI28_RODNA
MAQVLAPPPLIANHLTALINTTTFDSKRRRHRLISSDGASCDYETDALTNCATQARRVVRHLIPTRFVSLPPHHSRSTLDFHSAHGYIHAPTHLPIEPSYPRLPSPPLAYPPLAYPP